MLVSSNSFALPENFVYLSDIDPTIKSSLRYYKEANFIGRQIKGYNQDKIIMTKPAALALKAAQEKLKIDGFELLIYDAYRPQTAVDNFYEWSKDLSDYKKKDQYYPGLDKHTLFDKEYIMRKSNHSKGSTIDLTIMKLGDDISDIKEKKRKLKDGSEIVFLDDNSVDMGSSFDLFDEASHYDNNLIEDYHKEKRNYLRKIMESVGFKHYDIEWWHFTLIDEPFKDKYFNFPIE